MEDFKIGDYTLYFFLVGFTCLRLFCWAVEVFNDGKKEKEKLKKQSIADSEQQEWNRVKKQFAIDAKLEEWFNTQRNKSFIKSRDQFFAEAEQELLIWYSNLTKEERNNDYGNN